MEAFIWLGLLLLFLAIEGGTVSLVSIWFAGGALVALIVSLFCPIFWVQAVVFFAVSCVLLLSLRPITRKYLTPRLTKTNVDSVIGSVGKVTQTIDNIAATGQVKLGAMEWTARSAAGEVIPEGTLVCVERIEGVKVLVNKAEVPAEPV